MEFNADLVDDLARFRAELFLGSGVSSSATTASGSRFKGWDEFLDNAADKASTSVTDQVKKLVSAGDYLLACELLKVDLADEWDSLVQSEYGQAAEPSPLHEAIAKLDPRIIITTNFDKLIENSWIVKLGSADRYPTVLSSLEEDAFRALRNHDGRYLIKIHGTVDKPDEIVFAKSQYQQKAFSNWQHNSFLESILLNYTVIFIGFSMNDPAINSIIEGYTYRFPKCRPHYAFQAGPVAVNIADMSKRLRKLTLIQYDPKNNHAELPALLQELRSLVEARRKAIIAEAIA